MDTIDLGKLRFHFAGDWLADTFYEMNDVAKYGGNVYVYTYALRKAGVLPTDTSHWALLVKGINFLGVFSAETSYRVGDCVSHGGKVYVSILGSTNQTPPNITYWSLFADGISPRGVYNNATSYVPGDVVAYAANTYIALAEVTGVLPSSDPAKWQMYISGFRSTGPWANATAYTLNDVVTYGGNTYISQSNHTSISFAADLAAAKWVKFNSGIRYRGAWLTGTSYLVDDIVMLGNSTYIATTDHTAGIFATDKTANKWSFFAVGSEDILPPFQEGNAGKTLTVLDDGSGLVWTAKQAPLVSGVNIKTLNNESLVGSGNINISVGVTPIASGTLNLGQYFTTINWPSTNTQSYGWLIQRTSGVASGVAQFALVQGGYRAVSLGGCQGTIFPFQIAADSSFIAGTPTVMWTNSSAPHDFSTCSLVTDNVSGGFHYSGNIPWPGTTSHVMGWGTGLLGANNTASTFSNSGTDAGYGIHDHNGQFFGLLDSDGYGWYGTNNGYAGVDSLTRFHAINYSNPNSPVVSVQNPSANTSTSPTMQLIFNESNNSSNTAVCGAGHWRNSSGSVVARVYSPTVSTFTDYNSGLDWGGAYSSGSFWGVALANGTVLIYHNRITNAYLYTAHNSRTSVSSVFSPDIGESTDFGGACVIPDGVNSWLMLSGSGVVAPRLQKWSINQSTYVWTKNWEFETPLLLGTSSYLKLNKLPNSRIMMSERKSNGNFKWWIYDRNYFPA
jgi:hypothetical protein